MSVGLELEQARADDALPRGDILYEMVDGKLVEKDVSAYAAWIAVLLGRRLASFCEEHQVGTVTIELVFILDPGRKLRRRPDVAFVSQEHWPVDQPPPPTGDWEMIPDLAIEITSPHDSISKVMRKVREYFRYGVQEVWVIIPEGQVVQVYRSEKDVQTFSAGDEIRSDMLANWSMPVVELLPHEIDAELEEDASSAD